MRELFVCLNACVKGIFNLPPIPDVTSSSQHLINTMILPVTSHPVDLTSQPTVFPSYAGHRHNFQTVERRSTHLWFSVSLFFFICKSMNRETVFWPEVWWYDLSEPDFRIRVGGQYERVVLGWSKALNPQLLQWSCSVASRSDCGCSGQLPAVSLCVCVREGMAFLKKRAMLSAKPLRMTKAWNVCTCYWWLSILAPLSSLPICIFSVKDEGQNQ